MRSRSIRPSFGISSPYASTNDDGDVVRNHSERDRLRYILRTAPLYLCCARNALRDTMAAMKCVHCGKDLPQGSSSRRQFCDSVCRTEAWRKQAELSAQNEPSVKRSRTPNGTSATQASGRTRDSVRRSERRTENTVPQRLPMEVQLARLAPVGAVGYRLVFPSRTPDEVPRLSPQLDGNGYQGSYSLRPFQAPTDIRLSDGQIYRVIWTGEAGEIILPKQDGTVPGLRFFLSEAALIPEQVTQSETPMDAPIVASGECDKDATASPSHLKEQTTSDPVDDSSEFLEIPRLADDLRALVLELLDSFQDYAGWYSRRLVEQPSTDIPEVDPKKIDQYVLLAQRLCRTLVNRPRQVVTINMCARGWLKPWVAAILKFLCQNQRREDALALYELLGSTVGETQREAFLPRLEMLLFAEQFGKAKELAMSALDASPNELSVLAPATEALMVSGEYAIVEPHLKRYYQLARDFFQSDHFKLAVDRLALLYERLGRKEDSERLDRIFGAYGVLAHAERLLLQDPKGPIQPGGIPAVPSADPAPKQGKNRPCLCGSGKKYKLCCKPREEHQTGARLSRAT